MQLVPFVPWIRWRSYRNRLPPNSVHAPGILKNFNTIEDFKATDKTAFFNQLADEVPPFLQYGDMRLDCSHFPHKIWETAITKRDPSALTKFLVITFADLKKYKFFYWFAFPAFVSKPAWEILDPGWTNADGVFSPDAVSLGIIGVNPPFTENFS